MSAAAEELLEKPHFVLRSDDGMTLPLHIGRWFDPPEPEEEAVMDLAVEPVLDVGCGPGRHTVALRHLGLRALGVDIAPSAIEATRRRGGSAHQGSIFGPIPEAGSWGSALLLDGNIGIGGDPRVLLARTRELLRLGGRVLAEVEPPGSGSRGLRVRIESGGEICGDWFDWALVDVQGLSETAARVGFTISTVWTGGGRWFARLDAR